MPQSLSNILIHLVFSTKDRNNWITTAIEPELYAYLASIHKAMNCTLLKIGGTENHIHILCRLARTVTISKLVEELKKSSSKWIKTKGIVFNQFTWQRGYGVFSIGASNLNVLITYIDNQKQHHQRVSFENEYRILMKKYQIKYDERYLWD